MDSRYKFFDTIWNSQTQSDFKGLPNKDLFTLFNSVNDAYYTIPKMYQFRPDLIANNFYGDSKLYWVLIYSNGFNNSPEDFDEGVVIRIPTYQRVLELL